MSLEEKLFAGFIAAAVLTLMACVYVLHNHLVMTHEIKTLRIERNCDG